MSLPLSFCLKAHIVGHWLMLISYNALNQGHVICFEDKYGILFKCNEPYIISLKMFKWCYHMYNIFALKECQRKINKYMFYGVLRSSIKQHHNNVWKGDRQKR